MDFVNGLFEMLGGFFILPSILKLSREKKVHGICWIHAAFFWVWGAWNLVYYPSLGQWASLVGGLGVFIANTVWTALLILYSRSNHVEANHP